MPAVKPPSTAIAWPLMKLQSVSVGAQFVQNSPAPSIGQRFVRKVQPVIVGEEASVEAALPVGQCSDHQRAVGQRLAARQADVGVDGPTGFDRPVGHSRRLHGRQIWYHLRRARSIGGMGAVPIFARPSAGDCKMPPRKWGLSPSHSWDELLVCDSCNFPARAVS